MLLSSFFVLSFSVHYVTIFLRVFSPYSSLYFAFLPRLCHFSITSPFLPQAPFGRFSPLGFSCRVFLLAFFLFSLGFSEAFHFLFPSPFLLPSLAIVYCFFTFLLL
eukprot:TRINITY_DN2961_c0_g1_i1.p4 TRINITY_DN2961_c0_g1~~TRINITY_DN2961_c0_g1_i1.p4  ORF type:complete len:106 (-),score=1.68 TRINITY_DN2961_c0_g1_i1:221-538(-)